MSNIEHVIERAQSARRAYDSAVQLNVARWDVIAADLRLAAEALRTVDASLVGLRQQLVDRADDAAGRAQRAAQQQADAKASSATLKAATREAVRAAIAALPSFVPERA